MTADQTPREYAAGAINDARSNLTHLGNRVRGEENLIRLATAQAQLAIASALLDVANAIRGAGDPGPAVERTLSGVTQALRDGTGRRDA